MQQPHQRQLHERATAHHATARLDQVVTPRNERMRVGAEPTGGAPGALLGAVAVAEEHLVTVLASLLTLGAGRGAAVAPRRCHEAFPRASMSSSLVISDRPLMFWRFASS